MKFEDAFALLIGNEGGFTKDPKDRGNWTSGVVGKGELKGTKYGISAMAYPNLDIENLTLGQAQLIYKADYWNEVKCDQLPETIKFDMFDMAVNSGVLTAAKILQRAVGTVEDGTIGAATIIASTKLDQQLLDKRLSARRLLYISEIKTFPSYGRGWIIRVANNLLKD